MTTHRFVLLASVCLLMSSLALAAPPPSPAPAAGAAAADAAADPVFDGLTPDQKALADSLLNENSCDCGCGMKIAVCRVKMPKCPRHDLTDQVVAMIKKGKGREEIVKTVLTPASKFVQFAMMPGTSPSVGPKNAKVTIYHYTDYQ